jgi:hypothetical protein
MQTFRKLPTHAPTAKARLSTSQPPSWARMASGDVLGSTAGTGTPASGTGQTSSGRGRTRGPSPAECQCSSSAYEQTRFAAPAPGLLVQVQCTVALAWLVVTEKLVAVPVVLQVTPPEPVKPGSVLHAPVA